LQLKKKSFSDDETVKKRYETKLGPYSGVGLAILGARNRTLASYQFKGYALRDENYSPENDTGIDEYGTGRRLSLDEEECIRNRVP